MAFHHLDRYRHQKLTSPDRQIRLLSILPSSDRDQPLYSLQTYILNTRRCPNFYAVSYQWGTSDPMYDMVIDGKRFPIRKNLRNFLRRLGNADEAFIRPVWIDAICIDQTTTSERNAQVGVMGEIFSAAELVLTWLGDNDVEDGRLTETAYELEKWQGSRGWTSFLDRVHDSLNRPGASPETPLPALFSLQSRLGMMWSCIRVLCEQSYWSRLWIVQELVKAKRLLLLWGDEEIKWDTLAIAFRTIQLAHRNGPPGVQNSMPWAVVKASIPYKIWLHTTRSHQQLTLLETMERYQESDCSLRHDKAYALTGISRDANLLPVNYDTSIPDLYVNLMDLLVDKRHCIKYSYLVLQALQLDEWTLISGGGGPSSLKHHTVTCEAELIGQVVATKAVVIHEIASLVEAEVLEMLLNAKAKLEDQDITRILQWVNTSYQRFQTKYRNDINQVAFFATTNGQIGVTKSVILVGDSVVSLPAELGRSHRVFLRVASIDDISEDGHSARGGYESPQLSSPTQSSFLSDLAAEMITRVWLLPPAESGSPQDRTEHRSFSMNKIPLQVSYAELVALQNSLGFELDAPSLSSPVTSPRFKEALPARPRVHSRTQDPILPFLQNLNNTKMKQASSGGGFEKQSFRRKSGQIYVDALSRKMLDVMITSDESPLNSPE